MKNSLFKYSQGAQVKGTKSIVFFLLSIAFIAFFIAIWAQVNFIPALILVPIIAFCLVMAADVRGLEIDRNQNLYRLYRIRPWGKWGKWKDFSGYNILKLDLDTYHLYFDNSTYDPKGYVIEQHHHFILALIKADGEDPILVTEKNDYREAKRLLLKLAKEMNVEPLDAHRERVMKAKERRANRRFLS